MRIVGQWASKVASKRGARDLGEAAKEQIGRRRGGEGDSEAGRRAECASIGAAHQWLCIWFGIGCKSAATGQHTRLSGIGPQAAQSRRAQPLWSLRS
jgi:hypothetical protein